MKTVVTKTLTGTDWKTFKTDYDLYIKKNIRCINFTPIKHIKVKEADIWSVKFQEDLSI